MKTILVLLILVYVVVQDVFSNGLLSKFHQSSYKIKDVRMELRRFDKNYYNIFKITPFKYNRSITAHNLTLNFKVDVKDQQEILVQVYKFLSNEYREFAIRFQVNLEKAFQANIIGLASMVNCGNITSLYFYKEITYHICNFIVDESRFPPLVPSGKYKIGIQFLYLEYDISAIDIYAEVYTPIYPKK